METRLCIDALKKGLANAQPAIINSDQGSQFTSKDWVDYLDEWNIDISIIGKGRCLDNVYFERFWCSFKHGKFYLNEYNTVKELRSTIVEYVELYNQRRWLQSLNYETPAEVYFKQEGEACGRVLRISQHPSVRMDKLNNKIFLLFFKGLKAPKYF